MNVTLCFASASKNLKPDVDGLNAAKYVDLMNAAK